MQAVTFFFAFVAVLALIGVVFWLLRRFAGNRLGTTANRGRMPRLAVIDAAAVDGRRRLVLVRRDNVEHLLMIGGPSDIVVESNIVRAMPAREQLPHRAPAAPAEAPPRLAPLPEAANWSGGNEDAEPAIPAMPPLPPMPEPPPPRPARPAFADELRRPPPMAGERRDPLAGFALEPIGRPEPRPEPPLRPEPPVRAEQRGEPPLRGEPPVRPEPLPQRADLPPRAPARAEPMIPRAPRPSEAPKPPPLRAPAAERERAPAPPLPPSADQSLAEMAQRLEAALRRPPGEPASPPVAPEPAPPPPPQRAAAPRSEPAPPPAPAASPSAFDSLEDEMASLLGRSKSSSS